MAIEEKTKLIAENMPKVYNSAYNKGFEDGRAEGGNTEEAYNKGVVDGKLELLTNSEYMNASVSGTAISVNDVNAVEHSVGCYLTSDTITNFSGIEVRRYGKNLLPTDVADFKNNWLLFSGTTRMYTLQNLVAGQSYSFSFESLKTLSNYGYFRLYKTDGTTNSVVARFAENGSLRITAFDFEAENGYSYFLYGNFTGASGVLVDGFFDAIGHFQLELGVSVTPYEEYIEPITYQSTADGTVDGIKSISPNMTLISNNDGAVINCNYLRDIDLYIDNLITDVALTGGE